MQLFTLAGEGGGEEFKCFSSDPANSRTPADVSNSQDSRFRRRFDKNHLVREFFKRNLSHAAVSQSRVKPRGSMDEFFSEYPECGGDLPEKIEA